MREGKELMMTSKNVAERDQVGGGEERELKQATAASIAMRRRGLSL